MELNRKNAAPLLVLFGLVALTGLALLSGVDVSVSDEAGVRKELPSQAGEWIGENVFYCQNTMCQREWLLSQLESDRTRCPTCGGALDSASLGERTLLPADTLIAKKRYVHPSGAILFVSLVMSGRDRSSIHRPQVCLSGQGNRIVSEEVIPIRMPGRPPLKTMVLDLMVARPTATGETTWSSNFFAYWFVGKGRETPYHIFRVLWMSMDRLFSSRSHRWAFFIVAGARDSGNTWRTNYKDFLRSFYPLVDLNHIEGDHASNNS